MVAIKVLGMIAKLMEYYANIFLSPTETYFFTSDFNLIMIKAESSRKVLRRGNSKSFAKATL